MPKIQKISNEIKQAEKVNRDHRKITFAAVTLALLIHGLLLVLFDYDSPAPVYKTTGSPGVSFMSLGNLKSAKRQQLQNWLEYHEPSMISAPHNKYGYNQLVPQVNFRAAQTDLAVQNTKPEIPSATISKFRDLKPHGDSQRDLFKNYILHQPQIKLPSAAVKTTAFQKEKEQFPQIKANGKLIKLSLGPELIKKAGALKAKRMEINYRPGIDELFPRVVILKSSGNRDFDMAVLHELSLPLTSILKKSDMTIHIKWRAKTAEEDIK